MAYYDYTAADVRVLMGGLSTEALAFAKHVEWVAGQMAAITDAELVAKGMNNTGTGNLPNEVANIRSALTDLSAVVAVFRGTASATQADRQVFVKRLAGPVNV